MNEYPLRPLIIIRISRIYFPAPVKGVSHFLHLPAVIIRILLSCLLWRYPRLYRVILGRQTKGVPAHWKQDVVAPHSVETGINISTGVIKSVTDMQTFSRRIWKLHQNVFLFLTLSKVLGWIPAVFLPIFLPLGFDFFEIHRLLIVRTILGLSLHKSIKIPRCSRTAGLNQTKSSPPHYLVRRRLSFFILPCLYQKKASYSTTIFGRQKQFLSSPPRLSLKSEY